MGEGAKRVTTVIGGNRARTGRKAPRLSTPLRRTPNLPIPRAKPPRPPLDWAALFAEQRDRLILWLPIALMAGAAIYFTLPRAPALWVGPAMIVGGVGSALATAAAYAQQTWIRVARLVLITVFAGIAGAGAGLAAGHIRETTMASPKLAGGIGPVIVEGWVTELDRGATRPRLTIRVRTIEGVAKPPRFVRVSTTEAGALTPGRGARCRAMLHPPQGRMAPGAYDSAVAAYFDQTGATGFSLGACRPILLEPPPHWFDALQLRSAALRRALTESVLDAAPGSGGAVAAALITGDRSAIDSETTIVFQNSGLQHLLSVSGFHMSLLAGMIYAAVHVGLALLPGFALRFPIRKWAAATAIAGATIYLVISGLSVPAQRAYVMTAVVLGAVLVDRPAITMRGLAVAAMIVVLIAPEAVLTPGFQMSFAATAALVAAFEFYQARREIGLPNPGLLVGTLQSAGRWMAGALLASTVAGLATDPFALAHFQRLSIYALPANLAATPVISLIIAPAAGAAAVLAPFGLSEIPLRVMAWGLELLVAIGAVFADRPEAIRGMPKPPDLALILWSVAIAWACLWRGRLCYAALVPLCAGLVLYAVAPRPIIYLDGALQAVIAKTDTRWSAIAPRGAGFEKERLAQLGGLSVRDAQALAPPEECGQSHCAWKTARGRIAGVAFDAAGLDTLCRRGAIVISHVPAPRDWTARCTPSALIDPTTLAREGGATIYEDAAGVRVERARARDHKRSWDGVLTDSAE